MSLPLTIRTAARLHFGLLDTRPPFGGLGVMVEHPEALVRFQPAPTFSVDEKIESRARPILDRLLKRFDVNEPPAISVQAHSLPPSHSGFGSGTQLSLAIAEGICRTIDQTLNIEELSCDIAERGKRSAVGVHGYFQGGLIFESADDASTRLNPVRHRAELPHQWRFLLLLPKDERLVVSGKREQEHFAALPGADNELSVQLNRLVREQLLPAADSEDFERFTDALTQFNRTSGMLFASVQGGPYIGDFVPKCVSRLIDLGATGVGQSSWGPCVFACCENSEHANRIAAEMDPSECEIRITSVRNAAREVITE